MRAARVLHFTAMTYSCQFGPWVRVETLFKPKCCEHKSTSQQTFLHAVATDSRKRSLSGMDSTIHPLPSGDHDISSSTTQNGQQSLQPNIRTRLPPSNPPAHLTQRPPLPRLRPSRPRRSPLPTHQHRLATHPRQNRLPQQTPESQPTDPHRTPNPRHPP